MLLGKGPEWIGIGHHEQEASPPSKLGFFITFAGGTINDCLYIVQISTNCSLCKYKRDSCVQVKNKPCVECIIIMRLISWNHSRGSKTITPTRHRYNTSCSYLKKLQATATGPPPPSPSGWQTEVIISQICIHSTGLICVLYK